MAHDVEKGRKTINLSEWPSANKRVGASWLLATCSGLKSGAMPKPRYLWLHPGARVSPAEIDQICEWSQSEARRLIAEARK